MQYHPTTHSPPFHHPLSPSPPTLFYPPPTIDSIFINYSRYPTTHLLLSAVQKGTLLVAKCML